MRIAVTGSIATDHLMTFPGRFVDQLMPDKLHKVSLSFLADSLSIRNGGVAANMAFGMGCLGLRPLLIGTAGADFAGYRDWLEQHGVDTGGVRESQLHHTGRYVATTDLDMNQIASFYPGAMTEDREIDLAGVTGGAGGVDLILIGASDPEAMLSFTRQCRELGIAFASDTSWQLARMDGPQVRELVDGAAYLFSNEYEATLIEHKTGWSAAEVADRVGVRVTTLGADGARVERAGQPPVAVPSVAVVPQEPTGAGDAFRAGFLSAVAWGLSLERAAQLGNLIAAHALETIGNQEYELKPGPLAERFEAAYGSEAGQEIAAHYN
ncbi:MAG TPA: carbohydrate kinase family protein [Streptosporangiaceae bacterium]